MKNIFVILIVLFSIKSSAQPILYGVAKKTGGNKIIYLSSIDPATGDVNVFNSPLASNHIGLGAGNAYNFVDGLYYYFNASSGITETNVYTDSSQNISLNQTSLLVSPQYACLDLSMYGFNHLSSQFGKFDLDSGKFLSPLIHFNTLPGEDYTYDKINNRYLFVSGSSIISIDLNTMTSLTIPMPVNTVFRFPQYDCDNKLLYGCFIGPSNATYLASIDLVTGIFTTISQFPFVNGGILGGGTALDIKKGLYYYNFGSSIISVNISDGTVAANVPYSFSIFGPTIVLAIQIDQTCYCEKSINTGVQEYNFSDIIIMNPFKDELKISGITSPTIFKLYDLTSRLLIEKKFETDFILNSEDLQCGTYLFTLDQNDRHISGKLFKDN